MTALRNSVCDAEDAVVRLTGAGIGLKLKDSGVSIGDVQSSGGINRDTAGLNQAGLKDLSVGAAMTSKFMYPSTVDSLMSRVGSRLSKSLAAISSTR